MHTKHLKHAILAISLSGMIATHAHAGDTPINAAIQPDAPAADFTEADLHVLFDNAGHPMQLAALSQQEMRDTEGAWWFAPALAWTAGGAVLGATTAWRQNGTVTWRDIGAGATAGFYASPMGRPFGTVGRFVMGGFGSSAWY